MLPIWYKYFRSIYHAVRFPRAISKNERAILGISFAFVMMVALNSFIHHRYLFPVFGLIVLVAYKPITLRKKTGRNGILKL